MHARTQPTLTADLPLWLIEKMRMNPHLRPVESAPPAAQPPPPPRPPRRARLAESISPVDMPAAFKLLQAVQRLAAIGGWEEGAPTWQVSGEDRGLRIELIKPGRLVYIYWRPPRFTLDPLGPEARYLALLTAHPGVEVYDWSRPDPQAMHRVLVREGDHVHARP